MRGLFVASVLVSIGCGVDERILSSPASDASTDAGKEAGPKDAGKDAPNDGLAGDAGDGALVEPLGTTSFTFVHGVVDADRVGFCFSQVLNGELVPVSGVIRPSGGLEFGHSVTISDLGGFDWSGDSTAPVVIAGDFSLVAEDSCQKIVAITESLAADAGDAAPLIARPLTIYEEHEIEDGYHYLLAATGCAFSTDSTRCGPGSTPTMAPVLVPMSRLTEDDRVGLQAVNGARAVDSLGVFVDGAVLAENTSFASISPWPPYFELTLSALAASSFDVHANGAASPGLSVGFASVVQSDDFVVEAGRSYALVYLGGDPAFPAAGPFHAAGLFLATKNY